MSAGHLPPDCSESFCAFCDSRPFLVLSVAAQPTSYNIRKQACRLSEERWIQQVDTAVVWPELHSDFRIADGLLGADSYSQGQPSPYHVLY